MGGDILESHQEPGEVRVVVKLLDLRQRRAFRPMSLTKFDQSGRLDRALKMQMELRFRKRYQEWPGRRGKPHSRDCRLLDKAKVKVRLQKWNRYTQGFYFCNLTSSFCNRLTDRAPWQTRSGGGCRRCR